MTYAALPPRPAISALMLWGTIGVYCAAEPSTIPRLVPGVKPGAQDPSFILAWM